MAKHRGTVVVLEMERSPPRGLAVSLGKYKRHVRGWTLRKCKHGIRSLKAQIAAPTWTVSSALGSLPQL